MPYRSVMLNRRLPLCNAIALAISGFTVIAAPGALAQSEGAVQIEEIRIVGSRIIRQDEISTSPVQTLSEADLRADGSMSIGETLQSLPFVGPSLNNNGSAGTSHGSSSLNLRNIGQNRSLVLVNGHRWVNGAGTRGFRDFVDLNTIPQAMIERIEVLQDGATAVYGADAIAGVVNMHTYQNFEGLRIKTNYGETGEGDRETLGIDILAGRNFGNSNWTAALTHVDQKAILTQDRELTAFPLNGLSLGTPELLFRESSLAPVVGFTVPTNGITRDPGADGSNRANWRGVTANDTYNRYFNNYVVGPLERTSLFVQNTTRFSDALQFNFEALYNKRKSDQQFSEPLSSIQGSRGFTIPNNPAVNPFGVTFAGNDFRITGFHTENGYRVNEQEVETLRLGAGFSGVLANDWRWDMFYSWAENEAKFRSVNQMDLDRLALGMRNCSTTGLTANVSDLANGCVAINLFNPMTQAMVDYVNFTGNDKNAAEQTDFTANLTGEIMELPAGPLAFAAGIEYREELGRDNADSYINAAPRVNTYRTTSSAPRQGTNGKYDLSEAYVELSVPVLADKAFAKDLRVDLATRFSDYSTFGDTTNSKVGVVWRPIDDLMLRATWAEGFRAPSILELFEGARSTSIPVIDPCSGGGAGLIGCQGVPGSYIQPRAAVSASVGGNRNLNPETSENISYGFVYTPSALQGFSVTMDWYDIYIDNAISSFGAQNLLNLCASTGQRCNFITRDSSGEILDLADGPINLNSTSVRGADLVARYSQDNRFGAWEYSLGVSKLSEIIEESTLPNGNIQVNNKLGRALLREAFPELRANFSVRWRLDQWSANYSARMIGDTDETFAGAQRHIGTMVYHNAALGYAFSEALSGRVGIDNLADKMPPASRVNTNINFDQNTYNAMGRYLYLQLNYSL
jgi:iron complex outermembrane recepter protein